MKKQWQGLSALAASCALLTTGCLSTTRLVQKTQVASMYKTATVEELEKSVNDRDAAVKTLDARVLVTASTGSGKEGQVKEYTSLRGFIFVRQPNDLRVLLQKPYLGSSALDMVTDSKTFTLLINPLTGPPKAIEGTNQVTKPNKNGLMNLRPAVFFDSLLIPGVTGDDLVLLTESTRTLPLVAHQKTQIIEPDYELTVLRRKEGNVLRPVRVLHISRVDMLPFEQDIYDDHGRVETQATYEKYAPMNGVLFPLLINIVRPLDEYALKLDITKLTLNGPLEPDQFELKLPPGTVVEHMD